MDILAQITSALPDAGSAQAIGWLMVSAAAAVTAVEKVDGYIQRKKDKPTPSEVLSHVGDKFATKESVESLKTAIQRLDERLEAQGRETRQDISEMAKEFGQAIRDIPGQVIALTRKQSNP